MRVSERERCAGIVLVLLAMSSSGPALADMPSYFYTITPCRVHDSRSGDGPLLPGEQREIQVATRCGIPEDATAVAANLTAITPTAAGSFTVLPDPLHPTTTNALSFRSGETRAASGIYPLNSDGLGTLSLQANMAAGQVDLAVDVAGYFWDGGLRSQTAAPPVCKHGNSVQAIDCWEGSFLLNGGSSNEDFYLRAYREARIRIDFRQSGTLRSSTYAYWDGGRVFAFRTAFPFQGTWTWTAVCETCLDRTPSQTSGTVNVTSRRKTPVLYSRGALSVDPSQRFLRHQTGLKFFWLGDTAWAAPMRTYSVAGSANTWATYLADRVTPPSGVTPPPSAPTAGRYSVVQLSLAFHLGAGGYTACTDASCIPNAKRAAFTTTGRLNVVPSNRSYWNPEYWRNLDRLVYQANETGLVVVLTGVMDPFGLASPYSTQTELEVFARNLAARMAGFFVIYSVGWDNRAETATYRCGGDGNAFIVNGVNQSVVNGFNPNAEVVSLMKAVGTALNGVTGQLITTHLGGGTPFFGADNFFHDPGAGGQSQPLASAYSYFHREPWLDFHLFQSSQCNLQRASVFQHQGTGAPGSACTGFVGEPDLACVMRRARTMPAKFLSLRADDSSLAGSPVVKPVVNGEARYERTVPSGQPPVGDIAYQSRHAGHVTTLSGAFGFTGGVYNVGEWRWPGDGMGITGPQAGKSPGQLKFLSLFEEGQVMEWERLRRKELMLKNPGTNENERSVVAASESNQYIVAYLPERPVIPGQPPPDATLKLAIHQGVYVGFDTCRWSKTWWNPVNGQSKPVTADQITRQTRSCANGEPSPCLTFTFSSPRCVAGDARPNDRCDWVLLLDDLLACPSSSADAQVWSGFDPGTGQWGLYAQRKSPAGELVGEIASVAGFGNEVQASPKIANGQAQGALVVWTAEGVDGDGFGILARKLDADGLPTGPLLAVNSQSAGDQVEPSVAPVGATGYIITWTSYSEDGDQGEVYARYLDSNGDPAGDEFRVNVTNAGRQAASQVASDSQGNVLIAWESWGQDGDGNGVFARRFDPSGTVSEEFQVYQAGAGWQYLTSVQPDTAGTFEVHWQVFTPHGSDLGTYGQRISPQGVPRMGEEFGVAPPEGGVGH